MVKDGSRLLAGKVGTAVFIRTATMYYTGRLMEADDTFLLLAEAAWIGDTGRFADAFEKGRFSEVEPYPDEVPVLIAIGSVVDICTWPHDLPRTQN